MWMVDTRRKKDLLWGEGLVHQGSQRFMVRVVAELPQGDSTGNDVLRMQSSDAP